MKKNRFWALFLSLLLITAFFVPVVSADDGVTKNDSKRVSQEYALQIAQLHLDDATMGLPDFSDWKDATLEYDRTFYDLKGAISAYSFNVIKERDLLGYILISGTKENHPILEFGKGSIFPKGYIEENIWPIAKEVAVKKGYLLGDEKYLYLGATFYYIEYPLLDVENEVKEKVIVDIFEGNAVNFEIKTDDLSSVNVANKKQTDKIMNEWVIVDENIDEMRSGGEFLTSYRGSNSLYGVPKYVQPAGYTNSCAPTASAMVLGYWRDNGYPNFPEDGDTLIIELHSAMNTDPILGTYDVNIIPGIESVCQDYSYTDIDPVHDSYFTFSDAVNEIDADRPFHLVLHGGGAALGSSVPYENHSVTVVGWATGSFDALEIHDGWTTGTPRCIAFGNWEDDYVVYVRT